MAIIGEAQEEFEKASGQEEERSPTYYIHVLIL